MDRYATPKVDPNAIRQTRSPLMSDEASAALARGQQSITAGLGAAARGSFQMGAALDERDDKAERAWAARASAQARLDSIGRAREIQNEAPEGAEGHTDRVSSELAKLYSERETEAPSPRAAAYFRERVTELHEKLTLRADAFESAERVRFRSQQVKDAIDLEAQIVRFEPAETDAALARTREDIQSAGLPPDMRQRAYDEAAASILGSELDALIESNPRRALDLLKDGRYSELGGKFVSAATSTARRAMIDKTIDYAAQSYGYSPEAMIGALGLKDPTKRDRLLDDLPTDARRKLLADAVAAESKAIKARLDEIEPALRRSARDGSIAFDELRGLEVPGVGKLSESPEGLALINELESDFAKATKGRAALNKFIERVQGGGRLSAYDADDRKLADAAFESAWEKQQQTNEQAQEFRDLGEDYGVPEPKSRFDVALDVARHGAAPDVLIAESRQGLGGDLETRVKTLSRLSSMGPNGRVTLRGATNGDKVADAVTRFDALVKAGYAPEIAAEFAAPSSERAEVIKQSADDLRAVVRKEPITQADLIEAFGAIDGPDGGILSDPDEVGEGVALGDVGGLMAEYRRLLEVEFVQSGGDIGVAKAMAGARLSERYGATFLTDDPQVMQQPPDTTLGMGDDARREVKRQLGEWMSENAPEGAKVTRLVPEYDDRGQLDGYSVIFESEGQLGRIWNERFRVDGSAKRMREIENEASAERQAERDPPGWTLLYAQGMGVGAAELDDAADPEQGEPDAADESGAGAEMRPPAYRIEPGEQGRETSNAPGSPPIKAREDEQGRFELEGATIRYAIAPITYSKSRPQKLAGIVLHHTAPMDMDQLVRSMQTPQRRGGGPAAYYGYHFAIGPDGEVVQAAPLNKRTNHVRAPRSGVRRGGGAGGRLSNGNTVSISFVGAAQVNSRRQATGSEPSEAQVAAARRLIAGLQQLYDIPGGAIFGHGELQKDRHGDEGAALARELRGG